MSKLQVVAEPGKHEIRMTREFNAPRELVFNAYTNPALMAKWWGPATVTVIIDKMDVRRGGLWRFVQREPDGSEYAFHGVYHQVIAPERLVNTFEFEGLPGHVALETLVFEDIEGGTRIVNSSIYQSIADRDGMVQSGMEVGAAESWDRFEALLATLV
jgi:uncharacterized protein YndB with AHSA1/START domain